MKFRVKSKFSGDTRIASSPLNVNWPPYHLTFESDENGAVISVSVEVAVQDYKALLPTYDSSQELIILKYPENPVHADLLALLQYLESVGAFWFSVHEVNWEAAEFDWVPENDSETSELAVWNFRLDQKYASETTQIDESYVKTLLYRRPLHEALTVPLAFYREGKNEFRRFRYIQAFVNFYFMIEGLFGGGRPNYRVREQFGAAPTLVKAAGEAADYLRGQAKHWNGVRQALPSANYVLDANGILDLLVDCRGVLHHFSTRDSRPKAHPHNQRTFESVAFIAMSVCIKLIPYLIADQAIPSDVQL